MSRPPASDPGFGLRPVDLEGIGPAIGSRMPDVSLPDQNGRVVDLHRFRAGRPGVVVIYRSADW